MKRDYVQLLNDEMFKQLYDNSPVSERITSIRRRLASFQCKDNESLFLKGELCGLLEVQTIVHALAEGKDISTTKEGPTKHTNRLLEFAGFRDRYSAGAS